MKTPLLALVAVLLAGPAAAQAPRLAPGLWEHAVTIRSGSGPIASTMAQAQGKLAELPPEQRRMVEQMMAQRGVELGSSGGATTLKVCLTPEQAAREELPQDPRCSQRTSQRSGDTVHFEFSCSTNPPTSGSGEITLQGDKGYTGSTIVNSVVQGRPERLDMQVRGKWLGADCGSVKPRG